MLYTPMALLMQVIGGLFLLDKILLIILIQMRTRQMNEYPRSQNQDRFPKTNSPRGVQPRVYETIKARMDGNRDQQDHRKHNSPDVNRYRGAENRQAYTANSRRPKNADNEDPNPPRNQRRQKEDPSPEYKPAARGRQLNKNSSSPNLNEEKRLQEQENKDYLKLHEKLNFIESKIAQMKRHVQKKRQEKQQLLEARRRRQEQREEQRRRNEEAHKKVNLKQFITQVPEHKELHTFDKDPYSPMHNIYYISEIIKSYKDDKSLGREHLLTSLHILKILENSQFASDEEMRKRQVHLPRREGFEGRKTVIFDLDQTLIHCNDTLTPPFDVKLPITFPTGEVIQAGINIRPHAQQILQNLSKNFEIIVFTASHSCYANVVLDYLDPEDKYIHHRLFREHCYQTPQGMYCKDLRVIDRDMSEMVLVDNAAYSYAAQLDNGIPILPYYHGKTDFELRALEHYLEGMLLVKDVRTLNRKTFQLHRYRSYYNRAERLVEELYMQEENES